MISLISANWLFFLIALVIGVATAYWIWSAASRREGASDHFDADDDLLEKAGGAVVPTPAHAPPESVIPEPVISEPVTPVAEREAAPPPARPTPPSAPIPSAPIPPASPPPSAQPLNAPPAPQSAGVPDTDRASNHTPTKLAAAPAIRPRKRPIVAETAPPPPPGKPNIPPAVGEPDNLRLIKGVGPKLNTLLNKLGITRFDQIAEWKEEEIQEVDQYLESFSGRITRDSWIGQAKYLAKDDIAGFEQKYGKL